MCATMWHDSLMTRIRDSYTWVTLCNMSVSYAIRSHNMSVSCYESEWHIWERVAYDTDRLSHNESHNASVCVCGRCHSLRASGIWYRHVIICVRRCDMTHWHMAYDTDMWHVITCLYHMPLALIDTSKWVLFALVHMRQSATSSAGFMWTSGTPMCHSLSLTWVPHRCECYSLSFTWIRQCATSCHGTLVHGTLSHGTLCHIASWNIAMRCGTLSHSHIFSFTHFLIHTFSHSYIFSFTQFLIHTISHSHIVSFTSPLQRDVAHGLMAHCPMSFIWDNVPWDNVPRSHGTTCHETMCLVHMAQCATRQCASFTWDNVPWDNVPHLMAHCLMAHCPMWTNVAQCPMWTSGTSMCVPLCGWSVEA